MEKRKGDIRYENGSFRYFDMNGDEIKEGDIIQYEDGSTKKVYLTDQEQLGTDATNPSWIASGRAEECEYGIYPFDIGEVNSIKLVKQS